VANTGLAKVAVQCSAETFVVNQTLVLRINICGENRHLRQARNRQFEQSNSVHEQNATKIKQGEMPRLGPGFIAHEFGQNAARGRD
jgi:hypothetical protein